MAGVTPPQSVAGLPRRRAADIPLWHSPALNPDRGAQSPASQLARRFAPILRGGELASRRRHYLASRGSDGLLRQRQCCPCHTRKGCFGAAREALGRLPHPLPSVALWRPSGRGAAPAAREPRFRPPAPSHGPPTGQRGCTPHPATAAMRPCAPRPPFAYRLRQAPAGLFAPPNGGS